MFGTRAFLKNNYLYRYAGAKLGLYGNPGNEAIYLAYFVDGNHQPLDASKTGYELHFAKGHFKVLTGQGQNAPGGAMSYLDNGVMTKGFAVLAWPSEYKVTGVMTFQVDRTGILYEKDLGRRL